MKQLIVMRHAKSSWDFPELDDYDRPLNERGKKAAVLMGERLLKYGTVPDLVLSSGAKRAYDTAKRVCKVIGYPKYQIRREEELYMAGLTDFYRLVHGLPDEYQAVMLVSHNPGVADFMNNITNGVYLEVPTAALAVVSFGQGGWADLSPKTGETVYYSYPKAEE